VKLCSLAPRLRAKHVAELMRFLASIHDVAPRFETEVDRLVDRLRPYCGSRIALLVIPDHWGTSPVVPGSPFATRLRGWSDSGFEIFLHGFYHRDSADHVRAADRLRSRWMTAGEGEFLGLGPIAARERIERGRELIESIIGQPIAGFVAPAWLYGDGARQALSDCGITIAEDHLRVWSPESGAVLSRSPVITWASRTPARLRSSIAAASLLRRLPFRDLRISVHPGDCGSARLLNSIDATFRIASASRRPTAYRELFRTAS
jgi:predicted deacetylase